MFRIDLIINVIFFLSYSFYLQFVLQVLLVIAQSFEYCTVHPYINVSYLKIFLKNKQIKLKEMWNDRKVTLICNYLWSSFLVKPWPLRAHPARSFQRSNLSSCPQTSVDSLHERIGRNFVSLSIRDVSRRVAGNMSDESILLWRH